MTWGRGWMTKASGVGERRKGRGEWTEGLSSSCRGIVRPNEDAQWYIDIWYITMIYMGEGAGGGPPPFAWKITWCPWAAPPILAKARRLQLADASFCEKNTGKRSTNGGVSTSMLVDPRVMKFRRKMCALVRKTHIWEWMMRQTQKQLVSRELSYPTLNEQEHPPQCTSDGDLPLLNRSTQGFKFQLCWWSQNVSTWSQLGKSSKQMPD